MAKFDEAREKYLVNAIGFYNQSVERAKNKSLVEQFVDLKERCSNFYADFNHDQGDAFYTLENLVLACDDGRNLNKVIPVLSLIIFIFYNKSSFEKCIELGLFS